MPKFKQCLTLSLGAILTLGACRRPTPADFADSDSKAKSPDTVECDTYAQFIRDREAGKESALPDYSWAGNHLGASPVADVKGPVFNVVDYGATPDDEVEDKDPIQNAIRAAEAAGGGVVFFPPGRYLVNELPDRTAGIAITKPGIILRGSGSGPGGTEVFMRHYMLPRDPKKMWTVPPMFIFKAHNLPAASVATTIEGDAPRGAMEIAVKDASGLKAGEMIELRMRNPEANAEFLDGLVPWPKWTETVTKGVQIAEKHQVKGIKGNVVELAEPTRTKITSRYGWDVRKIFLADGWGIEDIWFRGNFKEKFVHHKDFIHDSGWSFLRLDGARNAWMRRLRFTDVSSGGQFVNAFACSALLIRFDGNSGHTMIGTQLAYGTLLGLIEDATDSSMWHGPCIARSSAGSVIWRYNGKARSGPDIHGSWSYCSLLDASSCGLTGNGGNVSLLPNHMRDFTFWNLRELGSPRSNFDFWDPQRDEAINYTGVKIVRPNLIGLHGAGSTFVREHVGIFETGNQPVNPESLYEAQLKLRLKKMPAWVDAVKAEWADYKSTGYFKVPE